MFEAVVARRDKQAKPNAGAVALVAASIRSCDRYVTGLEEQLLDELDPESRKELTLFIDETHKRLSNLRELMPHTNRKTKRMSKARKRSG